ncbi:E3 ubiquitin-protein ligase TRIM11-like [Ornithorhynchus anatinus]|uniref:E3 ubiquitin-protein ligase TRIM11-like n=1 Tax=Ornithorhynchus anatinus TaxID=9258 RepID=UPI0010A86071|nr:E3 ubiquitin-protein ligase TRIM11-like [Ornithorhynchus anatinus]
MDANRTLREELTCAVCLAYFTDPVTIDCGHSFCRGCLAGSWGPSAAAPLSCPECRKPSEPRDLRPNLRLGKLAAVVRRAGPRSLLGRSRPEDQVDDNDDEDKDEDKEKEKGRQPQRRGLCERHRQALKLFCREDEAPLCVACFGEGGHGDHAVSPLQEAAEDCKVKIEETLAKLWRDLEKAQQFLRLMKSKTAMCKKKVEHRRQGIVDEFEKIRAFLAEEEARQLQSLALEEEKILQRFAENERQVSRQSYALRKVIGELEEKFEKPDLELLQDAKTLLSRSEATELRLPQYTSGEVTTLVQVPGMREMLKQFQVDVTLDEATAHRSLVLSKERHRVKYVPQRRDLPDDPGRFNICPFVLGLQRFTKGKHYWEMNVEFTHGCVLGVCLETAQRKGRMQLNAENGFWILHRPKNHHPVSPRCSQRRVGIYLDYEGRRVSFYDVLCNAHLYTYKDCTFSGPLRPIFGPCLQVEEESTGAIVILPETRVA